MHAGSSIPSEGLDPSPVVSCRCRPPDLRLLSCRSVRDALSSNDTRPAPPPPPPSPPPPSVSSVTLLPCSRTLPPLRHFSDTPYCVTSRSHFSHTHTHARSLWLFPLCWRRRCGETSHLQPKVETHLHPSSSSFFSVTVWTLMNKRWVLCCDRIYLPTPPPPYCRHVLTLS